MNHNLYDCLEVAKPPTDVVAEGLISWEPKADPRIVVPDEMQLVNALVATGKPVGLLLGFAEKKENVTRKVNDPIQ